MSMLCTYCKHRRRGDYRCVAWPEEPGIPAPVLADLHDHRFPYPGDGGVRFELDLTLDQETLSWFRRLHEDAVHETRLTIWEEERRYASTEEIMQLLQLGAPNSSEP